MQTDKRVALLALHEMMHAPLFGTRPWLAHREICDAMSRRLDKLGLQEPTRDEDYRRDTVLGRELQLTLAMVFIGLWDEGEVPWILEAYGLIDKVDCDIAYARMEFSDPETVLRPLVQRAFCDYFNPSGRLA